MSRPWWVQRLFPARPRRFARRSALRPSLIQLEDRSTPATLTYTAVGGLLVFQADPGDADGVTVDTTAANVLRISVTNGDTITLAGDVGAGFTLTDGDTKVSIDTALKPATDFQLLLGDQDDSLDIGFPFTPSGVTNLTISGEGGSDTVTLGGIDPAGFVTTTAEVIRLTGNVLTDGQPITLNGDIRVSAAAIALDSEQGSDGDAGAIALNGIISATAAGTTLLVDSTALGVGKTGGPISYVGFGNGGGAFVTDLTFDSRGDLADGILALNGDIRVTGDAAANISSITIRGDAQVSASVSLFANDVALNGGTIDLTQATISGTAAGKNLLIQNSHIGGIAAKSGGAVTLGVFDTTGGFAINDLVIVSDTGGAGGSRGTVSFQGSATLGALLSVTSDAVTQGAGTTLTVTSSATFVLGSASVTLDNVGNDFASVAVTNGASATFRDTNAIDLGTTTLTGTLTVNAGGSISQSGAVSATTASLNANGVGSVFLNAALNSVGSVSGSAGALFAVTNGIGLTVPVAGISAPTAITLEVQNTTAGQDLVVTGSLSSVLGAIVLTSGNSVTATGTLTAQTTVTVTIGSGNADGRTADLSNATLTVPFVSLTGGAGKDQFSVKASATAAISVDGSTPSVAPGDKLTVDAQGAAGSDDGATVTITGFQPVSYVEIEDLDLINLGGFTKIVPGTAGADTLVLRQVAGVLEYNLNNAGFVAFVATGFRFDGLANADTMTADFSFQTINLPDGITFDGGADGPDLLRVIGRTTIDGSYQPSATTPGDGLLSIDSVIISFQNLTPVDVVTMASFTVTLPGLADVLTISEGVLFGDGTKEAIRVAGTTAGVAIETVAVRDVAELSVDTTAVEAAANPDSITITALTQAPLVDRLIVITAPAINTGTDLVTIAGAIDLADTLAIQTNTLTLSANVTTGADQFYAAKTITLTTNVTLESTGAGTIDLGGAVGGLFDLVMLTTGSTIFTGTVSVNAVATDAGGTTAVNGGSVVTVAAQTFNDAVIVGQDTLFESTTNKDIAFLSTLDGGFNVQVKTTGATTFGAVGSTATLGSLTTNAGGTTTLTGALVKTFGVQNFGDAVDLPGNTTFRSLSAGAITFGSTLDGPGTATIETSGVTTFTGKVGNGTALGSLTTDATGATVVNGGLVLTTGLQSYGDGVTVGANTEFRSVSSGDITFGSLLGGPFDVSIFTAGVTKFSGIVNLNALATDVTGSTTVNTPSVSADTTLTFNDPVTLAVDTTFTSATGKEITFASTVNGPGGVTVATTGTTFFVTTFGQTTPLAFVITNAGGTTKLGGNGTTTGGQQYGDAVVVLADVTLASTAGGNIVFASTLNGPGGATIQTTGTTAFQGIVGGVAPLTKLVTDGPGNTVVSGGLVQTQGDQIFGDGVTITADTTFTTTAGALTFASALVGAGKLATLNSPGVTTLGGSVALGSLVTDAAGRTDIGTASVTTTGPQTFNDQVRLKADATFTSTGNAAVSFLSTLDGSGGGIVNTGGTTLFQGPVGGFILLTFLRTDAPGVTAFAGGLVQTQSEQTYLDGVTLLASTDFAQPIGGAIRFGSAVVGNGNNLRVLTSGLTTFDGPVEVNALETDLGGVTQINGGSVTTQFHQSYGDPVRLGANTTMKSLGGLNIDFQSTVDGPGGLTIETGLPRFVGSVGATTPLGFLALTPGGEVQFAGNLVQTTGTQTYGRFVGIHNNTTFRSTAGGAISVSEGLAGPGPLNNFPFAVAFETAGTTNLSGPIQTASLVTDAAGTTVLNGPVVSTIGFQIYNDPVTIPTTVTVQNTTGAIVFANTLNGPGSLISPSVVSFQKAVGATTPLFSVAITGTANVSGGSVVTLGGQDYGTLNLGAKTTLTATAPGSGTLSIGNAFGNGFGLLTQSPSSTLFTGTVSLASLETDAPGTTIVATNAITTSGAQIYRDGVLTSAGTTIFTGGSVAFQSVLLNNKFGIQIVSPGETFFGAPVEVGFLVTDAPGTTKIATNSMKTATFQSYGDPVSLTGNTIFDSDGGGVRFGQSLTGLNSVVTVLTDGSTLLDGPVSVFNLITDSPGFTQVNGGAVAAAGNLVFGDAVVLGANATFAAGTGTILFNNTLTGAFSATLNATGASVLNGAVDVTGLTTDFPGVTVIGASTISADTFAFNDGVQLQVNTTFDSELGGLFTSALVSPAFVAVTLDHGPGDVTLNGEVQVGSLQTRGTGRVVVNTSRVTTTADQLFGLPALDPVRVVLGVNAGFTSQAGQIVLSGPLDAATTGVQSATLSAPVGSITFAGPVGVMGELAAVAVSAVNTTLAADFRVRTDTTFTLGGGLLNQTTGAFTTDTLGLFGFGTYVLDQPGNDIRVGLRGNVGSTIRITDANELPIDLANGGLVTNNGDVFLTVNGNFLFEDTRSAAEQLANPLINLGTGTLTIILTGGADRTVRFNGEVIASQVFLGIANGQNFGADAFTIRPTTGTPITVFGNEPVFGEDTDTILPIFDGLTITTFNFDGQRGFFDFAGRARITFNGIESINQLAVVGFVVQTTEPRDGTGSQVIESQIQIQANLAGTDINDPITNPGVPENPFVVTPARVNPVAPSSAPRLAFADFNGDGRQDMAVANGPGTSPKVSVFDLGVLFSGTGGSGVLGSNALLAEFFAYDPNTFSGGVNIAAGDLDGDGQAEIVTGADIGGGAHIRSFSLGAPSANVGTPNEARELRDANGQPTPFSSFLAYEPSFRGGVRVAVGDVNADGRMDLVYAAAADGGPRVTVRDGKTTAIISDFFAYDPGFRGGLYVDVGDFDNDGKADILTGPGVGAGSHVKVFDGETVTAAGGPTLLKEFLAFNSLGADGKTQLGVGGVAFGAFDLSTKRSILVATPRGVRTQVLSVLTDSNPATPIAITDLTAGVTFRVPSDKTSPVPGVDLIADQLTYGATVAGFGSAR